MSPLYPYLLAAVSAVTGNMELWMRILQAGFGAMTAVLAALAGRRMHSAGAGIIAGALTAIYAPLIYFDGLLLTESLLTLLVMLAVFFLLRAVDLHQRRDWIFAALALGFAGMTRASVLLFLPVFLLAWMFLPALREKIQKVNVLLYTALVLLCLLPTTVHNATTEGVFLPVTASFGFNLYAGNNAKAEGQYTMPEPVDLDADLGGRAWAEQQTGRELNASELSAWWRDRALSWMGKHPVDAITLYLRKLILFFYPHEIDQLGMSLQFFVTRYGALPALPQAAFPVLFLFSAAGLGMLFRKAPPISSWLPALFLLTFVLVTAVFFISTRMRLPVMPLLFCYAGAAAMLLYEGIRKRVDMRTYRVPVAATVLAGGLLLLLQPAQPQDFSLEYIKLGKSAFGKGNYARAEEEFRHAVEERQSAEGMTNLGNALAAQQRSDEAAAQYRAAIRKDSTYALAFFNFGNLWMQANKPQYAYGYWKKSLEHDPRLAAAHRNLGLLLFRAGRLQEAAQQLRAYLELERDENARAAVRQDLVRIEQLLTRSSSQE